MLKKLDQILYYALAAVVVAAYTALVVLVSCQVFVRFFTEASLTWSEELSTFIMIWMVLLGSALVFRDNGHIWVENFVDMMPNKFKHAAQAVGDLMCVIFFIILLIGATIQLPNASIQLSPANKIPMSIIYAAMPLSMGLSVIYAVRNLVIDILAIRKEETKG